MGEKLFIQNMTPGMKVDGEVLFVEEKTIKTGKRGPYMDLLLKDKTGRISCKVWDNVDQFDVLFTRGDFITVHGSVGEYNEKPQFNLTNASRIESGSIDIMDFIESIPQETIDTYFGKILQFIQDIKNPHYKQLLDSFFQDPDFVRKFKHCPGAKTIHHAKIGGLVKHVGFMLMVAKSLVQLYKVLDADLLYSGVILHDIGKTRELDASHTITYTTVGELIGHSVLGIAMIREKTSGIPDFPEHLAVLLEHLLLSHHGEPEYGATKRPLFREAVMLHYIDNIDAKMEMMTTALNSVPEEELWTEKIWALENSRLLRIDRFCENV